MIGHSVTEDGKPIDSSNLSKSAYQPDPQVVELFSRCQRDYQTAWRLQHRSFDEFDGVSLLQRARKDQETFGAFVGATYIPKWKQWKWQGRKNTARNKLIGILAHMISGMLYPLCQASNELNEEDKMSAKVMRIMVENHLREANYETKFLYMVLSALVNPATIVRVEYLEAMQRIKEQLADGKVKIHDVADEFLSGLSLNIRPIDQFLIADFFTPDVQSQPYIIDVERMSYDKARKIWGGHPDFKFVEAGKTRVVLAGQEHISLYDIEWTEADRDHVQVITVYYRDEDLQARFVGGVFVGEKSDIYNRNPFSHRRLSLVGDTWMSIPIYPFGKTFFEPIDPTGRFFYGKSGAFKEYWDDATQNKMHQLLVDGTYLDVFKPMFISGILKIDNTVLAPSAVITMPKDATATPFALGPNLVGAINALKQQVADMSESTQDKIMQGSPTPGITATQSIQAQNQARVFIGVFSLMIADLVRQVGELVVDCINQHVTVGEVDATVPGVLRMKEKTLLMKSKERGKDITNRIMFTDTLMGREFTDREREQYEWRLWESIKDKKDQVLYHVNPYRFARMKYSMYIDPTEISNAAFGNDRLKRVAAFNILTDPRIAPFTDQKAVADDMIEEFTVGDPDRFKSKVSVNEMMQGVMGQTINERGGAQRSPSSQMVEALTS